jgi:preprotein translocase subunit SecG
MAIFHNLIQVIQIIAAIAIIFLVLMQHGKGADMGAAFGSGASGSVFGASGSANFLSRATSIAATFFFTATLMLAFVINNNSLASKNIIQKASEGATVPKEVPATKAVPPISKPNTPIVPTPTNKITVAPAITPVKP